MFRYFLLIIITFMCVQPNAYARTLADENTNSTPNTKIQAAIENLSGIEQSLKVKRDGIDELNRKLKQTLEPTEKQEIEQKIAKTRKEIADLRQSFEQVALSGLDISIFTEPLEQEIDWRDEIEQIGRPILSTLKELTAKPRQIENFRREISYRQEQLKVIEKALAAIHSLNNQTLPGGVSEFLNQLRYDWQQRKDESERALQIANFQLADLLDQDVSWRQAIGNMLTEFMRGRGLTLLLVIAISLLLWLVMKGLLKVYLQWPFRTRQKKEINRMPLVLYGYRLITVVVVVLALLTVFYVRGDLLLLTIAVIVITAVVLSLRQTLPHYASEIRLLLGIGPVRESERLILDGVPLQVDSINIYSTLRNPELEGLARLPLRTLNNFISRPVDNEPWFPCKPGDYVLLPDGTFGKVVRQTIELVELMVIDSIRQIRTSDFLGLNIRNLSRKGYAIATTFGIDYQHQAICLDVVPTQFREAIIARFEHAGLARDIESVLVEFKEAGPSSLDYQIYVAINGRAASSYFKVGRIIKQACVDCCNQKGWVIPFTQITVHQAEGSE